MSGTNVYLCQFLTVDSYAITSSKWQLNCHGKEQIEWIDFNISMERK